MKNVDYDLVIIGGGPAGLTAGLYAARARLNAILIEKMAPGGQVIATDWIDNYPGFPEGISGPDLVQKMTQQAKRFDLNIEANEVTALDLSEPIKKITLNDREITSHTMIIAAGASPKKLGVPGEDTFWGQGVSACATCDGPFYKDSVVAAVGGGDTAIQESLFLTKFAKKIYLIHRRDKLKAAAILQEQVLAEDKIEIVWDSILTGISGLTQVETVSVQNLKTGDTRNLAVDGCFIWVGTLPNTAFVPENVKQDEYGFIVVDLNMETSVPGVYAAGDVRSSPLRQIATAVGDAATATFSAEHYLQKLQR